MDRTENLVWATENGLRVYHNKLGDVSLETAQKFEIAEKARRDKRRKAHKAAKAARKKAR